MLQANPWQNMQEMPSVQDAPESRRFYIRPGEQPPNPREVRPGDIITYVSPTGEEASYVNTGRGYERAAAEDVQNVMNTGEVQSPHHLAVAQAMPLMAGEQGLGDTPMKAPPVQAPITPDIFKNASRAIRSNPWVNIK